MSKMRLGLPLACMKKNGIYGMAHRAWGQAQAVTQHSTRAWRQAQAMTQHTDMESSTRRDTACNTWS